jgi:hypothetical protein
MQDQAQMKSRRLLLAVVWISVAVAIRAYGARGGDAAIVSGLLFLLWTVPFGVIWQFLLYERTLPFMSVEAAQALGDFATIVLFVAFWFVLMPLALRRAKANRRRDND